MPCVADYLLLPIASDASDSKRQMALAALLSQDVSMQTPPQSIVAGSVRVEVKNGQLHICPSKNPPGAPVVIDLKRLENWAKRIYREEVLK